MRYIYMGRHIYVNCEYSLICICKQMLLDGMYVTFTYIAFELNVLQLS